MAKTKTGNGRIYSDNEIQMARFLYVSGENLEYISKRLGMSISTLGRFSRDGKWIDSRMPKASIDDLYDLLVLLAMKEALKLLFDNLSEEQKTAQIERMRRIVFTAKAICDIAPMEGNAVVSLMKYALAKHEKNPALRPAIDIMQEFYNTRAGVVNEEQAEGGERG